MQQKPHLHSQSCWPAVFQHTQQCCHSGNRYIKILKDIKRQNIHILQPHQLFCWDIEQNSSNLKIKTSSSSYGHVIPHFPSSAPCPPVAIEKSVWCDNHTASISWSVIPGAVTYTATLEQINGNTTCCTTSDTSCDIPDLPCGEMFILLITAEGRTCNSSQSAAEIMRTGMLYIMPGIPILANMEKTFWVSDTSLNLQNCKSPSTAPCIPQNLMANLSCSDNMASTSWSYGPVLGQLFTVTAVSSDGHTDQCISREIGCDLTGLLCGRHYTTTALVEHSDCKSKPSNSITIKTGMCSHKPLFSHYF